MLSLIVEHTSVWEGVGGRREISILRGSPQWNTKAQLPMPQTATVSTAQWPKQSSTYPNNRGERTASTTEQISKKGIKLILKTIGNRKGDCAWSCSRWQAQPEKICKLQSTNQYNVRSELHWFVRCDLQIFSGCVCHLEQLHAQSPFLFPIVFSIKAMCFFFYVSRHFFFTKPTQASGKKTKCPKKKKRSGSVSQTTWLTMTDQAHCVERSHSF